MILDTSAVIAVVLGEEYSAALSEVIDSAPSLSMAAPTYVELSAIASRRLRPEQSRMLERLLESWDIQVVAFDRQQAEAAATAYKVFGKGSGHPAQLNLGDCFSYALASVRNEALLFIGNDFIHTDIEPALVPQDS